MHPGPSRASVSFTDLSKDEGHSFDRDASMNDGDQTSSQFKKALIGTEAVRRRQAEKIQQ